MACILYLDSFTTASGDSQASDEIGYGITASMALKDELRRRGWEVDDLQGAGVRASTKGAWIQDSYQLLWTADLGRYDAVFVFHAFHQFPSEIRRILLQRGYRHIKIFGFTHGSHWDPTDWFRSEHFPDMKVLDLANLMAMDRVFVVSRYLRDTILASVAGWSRSAAEELAPKLCVVGLPINDELIESYRRPKPNAVTTVIFNHSATKAKAPSAFFRVIDSVMDRSSVKLVVTRAFGPEQHGADLGRVVERHPGRVTLGRTLPLPRYYEALWESHIQVSTANHESLGIATLEAMYTENCCLLPHRLSYPELTGGLGLYDSERHLLELLEHYIQSPQERAHAGVAMRRLSQNFLPLVVVERVSTAMEEVFAA
jgi:hypothetical protein